jgi:hypothetical protein
MQEAIMPKKPTTIKITRAIAGLPRNYSEDQINEIFRTIGPLPKGKILYQGDYAAFSVFGEAIPELAGMWQRYMHDKPRREMTRALALRCHVEGAAYKYKNASTRVDRTPSQNLKYLAKIEGACDLLLKEIGFFDCLPLRLIHSLDSPNLQERVERVLTPLKEEILKQKVICAQRKIPRSKRHRQDTALHNLVLSLCDAWEYIAEKKVTTGSVGTEGKSGGPLIRFIQSVLVPLEIDKTPNAIREILKDLRSNQKI